MDLITETVQPEPVSIAPVSGSSAHHNKLSNLQRIASLSESMPFDVPDMQILDEHHFVATLESIYPGRTAALLPEMLNPQLVTRLRQDLLVHPLPTTTIRFLRKVFDEEKRRHPPRLSIRSCFALEDCRDQSFAGVFETVHDVTTFDALCKAVQLVYASVFSERARLELQRSTRDTLPAMSVAIQNMLGGDGWLGGVAHTQAPDLAPFPLMLVSVDRDSAAVTSGATLPEDYLVHRDLLRNKALNPILQRQAGTVTNQRFSMTDEQLRSAGDVFLDLEGRFETPLEIEWLQDPVGRLYLLQARPTPGNPNDALSPWPSMAQEPLATGLPVGHGTTTGRTHRAGDVSAALNAPDGCVLIAETTDPEWVPAIRRAAGIVTRIGARTSHVSRTARESGILAVVGCGDSIDDIPDDCVVTLFCAEGLLGAVCEGALEAGELLTAADSVAVRSVSEAFSVARGYRPVSVHIELESILRAFRLPVIDTATSELTDRIRRRIAGYPSVDTFVHAKLVEAICLISVAFPHSNLTASLPVDSSAHKQLPSILAACRRMHGVAAETVN